MPIEYEDKPTIVQVDKTGNHVEISYGGPQGEAGISAIDIIELVSYSHTQSSASSTWTIVHNLGFCPNATVFDSAGSQVEGSVTHTTINSLTIAFSAAISGIAHLS